MKVKWNKALALLLALAMAFALTACNSGGTSGGTVDTPPPAETPAGASDPAENQPEPEQTPEPVYPMTLVDMAGHEITLEKEVETVALTWRMANDCLLALGAADRMVCVGPLPDFDAIVAPNWVELSGKAGRGTSPDWEVMADLAPDLYINGTNSETLEAGDQLGIPVLAITMEDMDETMEALRLIGKALGLEDRAEMLCDYYDSIMSIPEERLSRLEEELPTFLLLSGEGETVGTPAMMQAQMVAAGGGVNAAAEITSDELWPAAGVEQVFSWDPDYIFMSATADRTAADILGDPAWADLTAVKNGNVYDVPSALHSWEGLGLSPCLGTVWSLLKMHPDLYTEEELDTVVKEFYQTVYGLEADRELLGY